MKMVYMEKGAVNFYKMLPSPLLNYVIEPKGFLPFLHFVSAVKTLKNYVEGV